MDNKYERPSYEELKNTRNFLLSFFDSDNTLNEFLSDIAKICVDDGNVIIYGGCNSGKSTLLRIISNALPVVSRRSEAYNNSDNDYYNPKLSSGEDIKIAIFDDDYSDSALSDFKWIFKTNFYYRRLYNLNTYVVKSKIFVTNKDLSNVNNELNHRESEFNHIYKLPNIFVPNPNYDIYENCNINAVRTLILDKIYPPNIKGIKR